MANVHGLDADIYFGDVDAPLPDWRSADIPDDDNENDEDLPTSKDVIAMLGYDPDEE